MCGITAIFAYHGSSDSVRRDEVESITRYMAPRGPDAHGTWFSADGRVGLGSRRLAIIDLSPEGTQPMFDVERDLVIVFNGEIYNHRELRKNLEARGARFHSTSDTEVLLQMYRRYGESMVELLRGMFAFAIWDTRKQQMFMARDPYGIKPLYFADDGQTFRAASTVKALLAGGRVSRTRDNAGVAGFLMLGSVPEPYTIYSSIRSFEPGTSLVIEASGRNPARRYYSIPEIFRHADEQRAIARLAEPATLLREMVTESIDHHLIADVPVGAFLSAGIDSSTLTALAIRRSKYKLSTITIRADEYAGKSTDEAPAAERFAKELGAEHTIRMVTKSEFRDDLPKIFAAMDQPATDGVNTWFVSKAAAEQGLKVAISGVGGDELFGSYPAFKNVSRIERLSSLPLSVVPISYMTHGNPKAKYVKRYGGTLPGAYFIQRGLFMPDELPTVMDREAAEDAKTRLDVIDHIGRTVEPDPKTRFGRVATLEASLYMRNQLLRDTDWASMAHSLEVRTPLVDASLLRQLAPLLLEHGSKCKQFFAESPSPPLPEWLRKRKKTGFALPLKEWMNLAPDGTTTRMRSWARLVLAQFD